MLKLLTQFGTMVKRISKLQKFFEDSVEATAHVNLKVYPNHFIRLKLLFRSRT